MANSIRTPRQGTTPGSRRIAQAVDNEQWQEFRLALKGTRTQTKLNRLKRYYEVDGVRHPAHTQGIDLADCDICIRIDNYIKALCRGGQLFAGESLQSVIDSGWNPAIKS
jgi:hypothetical protein